MKTPESRWEAVAGTVTSLPDLIAAALADEKGRYPGPREFWDASSKACVDDDGHDADIFLEARSMAENEIGDKFGVLYAPPGHEAEARWATTAHTREPVLARALREALKVVEAAREDIAELHGPVSWAQPHPYIRRTHAALEAFDATERALGEGGAE